MCILVPLSEIIKISSFKKQVSEFLGSSPNFVLDFDFINEQDESLKISIGPYHEKEESNISPFYVTLTIHDQLLHNCMLYSGASHNLMPKVIMEKLGFDITKPYKYLCTFDSNKVWCLGLIKDLFIYLAQIPNKIIIMDIVVVDVLPSFGMLLSRSWGEKLGGTIQLDLSYETITFFGGKTHRLYREARFTYTLSDVKNSHNHPVYAGNDRKLCISIFSRIK